MYGSDRWGAKKYIPGVSPPETAAPAGIARTGIALSLTTLGVLVLELSLTRLFSVVLFYHYAFLVISIALLGLACGGIFARLSAKSGQDWRYQRALARACMGGAISLIPVLSLVLGTNLWLVTAWQSLTSLAGLFLACAVPFAFAGYVVATAIARAGDRVPAIYFFDLIGASAGCLIFVPVIGALGGPATVLSAGVIWSLAAIAWISVIRIPVTRTAAGIVFVLLGVLTFNAATGRAFDVRYLHGAPVKKEVFKKWNSFSRVSVQSPDGGKSYWLEIDGGAGSWISTIEPNGPSGAAVKAFFGSTGPEMAYWLTPKPKTLVIGPGGGVDIARALVAGSPLVTAVEINPLIAHDVMLGAFLEKSHSLYARPDVQLLVEDGRTFIERTSERFDVILLSQVDTWASAAAGSYALTENYLYTVDALQRYLAHLSDRGILSIGRWEFKVPRETLRLEAIALEALRRSGVSNPADHVVVLTESMGPATPLRMGTVLVSRMPWDSARLAALDARLPTSKVHYAWAPGHTEGEAPFQALALAKDPGVFFSSYPFNVTPVTDDKPFFFFSGRWSSMMAQLSRVDITGDALNTNAQFLLGGLLLTAAVAVLAFLFIPMLLFGKRFPRDPMVRPFLGFGVCLGLGYIIVEVALIQKLIVLLGQPVYALTVVVFVLLLSSALGSRFSGSFAREALALRIRYAVIGIVFLAGIWIWPLPLLTRSALALGAFWKIISVSAAIFPLGFLMGIPFPSGLRLASGAGEVVEWTWTMNAAASVLGSVLAIFVAVTLGIPASFAVAAATYMIAALLAGPMATRATTA